MTNFERIKTSISTASVEVPDKQTLIDIFAEISDENLVGIADLFGIKPEWVAIFNDNRKKKNEAYAAGNESLWAKILEEEKKYLNELTYGLD